MKKYLLSLLIFLFTLTISAQEINWITLNEAIELQKTTPKKIMMDIYTNWCGPCKLLDKKTFHNADLVNYVNTHFYAVKFNGEGNEIINYKDQEYANPDYIKERANSRNTAHQFSNFLGIVAYPTIVFLDENTDLIIPLKGYKTPQQLEFYLKLFKNNDHKKMDNQDKFDAYYNSFKSEFKD